VICSTYGPLGTLLDGIDVCTGVGLVEDFDLLDPIAKDSELIVKNKIENKKTFLFICFILKLLMLFHVNHP
jgi:hypothetical protein